MIERVRPVIIELERMRIDVLVISHQVVMKTLLSYFAGLPLTDIPRIQVPLHTLYRLEPKPYGSELTRCRFH
jgi:6-phosphofructo-2-kinase